MVPSGHGRQSGNVSNVIKGYNVHAGQCGTQPAASAAAEAEWLYSTCAVLQMELPQLGVIGRGCLLHLPYGCIPNSWRVALLPLNEQAPSCTCHASTVRQPTAIVRTCASILCLTYMLGILAYACASTEHARITPTLSTTPLECMACRHTELLCMQGSKTTDDAKGLQTTCWLPYLTIGNPPSPPTYLDYAVI